MHRLNQFIVGALASASLFLTSCSSIVSKSNWPVSINSTPQGASVKVTNAKGVIVANGVTPTVITLKSSAGYFKRATYTLEFHKAGYGITKVQLIAKVNGWYAGNFVFGGLIGLLIVDPSTGAMYKLDHHVDASLGAEGHASTNGSASQLKIVERSSIPAEWEGHLVALTQL